MKMSPLGFFISTDQLGRIHPEGLRQLADRAPLGLRHVAGEGESYMGLFPRTVGKRFSRPDRCLLGVPSRPRLPGRERESKEEAREGSCGTLHLYPAPQDVGLTGMPFTGSRRPTYPHRTGRMQDPEFGLRRTTLLGTSVNKPWWWGNGVQWESLPHLKSST